MSSIDIGTLDWSGCCNCSHSDISEGGCDVDNEEFRENIIISYDSVLCGCFKLREKTEDDYRKNNIKNT